MIASHRAYLYGKSIFYNNLLEPRMINMVYPNISPMIPMIIPTFSIILENFCLCLIQRTLGELPNFGVMIWQLYYMLRSALICFQVTRFRNKGNHFI